MNPLPLYVLFWLAVAAVGYAYVLYPVFIATAAAFRAKDVAHAPCTGSVSIILAVYNEAGTIERRVHELLGSLAAASIPGELIVVSDGSTDGSVELLRALPCAQLRIVALPDNVGKATAISEGAKVATGDLLVFADARQRWTPATLVELIQPFADPEIGAVGGELKIDGEDGALLGVGLYWRFEKWLRGNESRVHSTVGVSGSVSATRRALFRRIPALTVLDDVYWPMQVVMQGFRVAHTDAAIAFDTLPPRARDEFRRKVRTLSGNFQLVGLMPELLLPWRNPIWLQFVSHKLMRLLAPWALLMLLVTSVLLDGALYRAFFFAQVVSYILAIAGLVAGNAGIGRLLSPFSSFLLLNAAAWLAFWVFVSGGASRSWKKVPYAALPGPSPGER